MLWASTTNAFAFWLALSLLAYVYVGYPLVAWMRAVVHSKSHCRVPSEPFVSVVVAAYNEAERIERRIENLMSLDYPREKLEIIVASDGSTDDTATRARWFRGVRVWAFDERRGKSAVLNDLVPMAQNYNTGIP